MNVASNARRLSTVALCAVLPAVLAGCAGTVSPETPVVQEAPADEAAAAAELALPEPPVHVAEAEEAEPDRFPGIERGRVRAALLLPLSGRQAAVGKAIAHAAWLALFDRADEGFVLLPGDTGGAPEGAAAALENALSEGADIVLGPLLGDSARRIAPLVRSAGVPVISFTNDRRVAGDGLYVMGVTPARQVETVVAYARSLGHVRFGALLPRGPYGEAIVEALREAAVRHTAAVGRVAYFEPGGADAVTAAIESLVAARTEPGGGFDALLIAAGNELAALAPLLPYHGLDPAEVRFFGVGVGKDPTILGEPALLDAFFAAPGVGPAFRDFAARYHAAVGAQPPPIAALGYDAVALAAAIADRPGGAGFGGDALNDPAGFVGIGGIFRFRDDNVAERGLAIYRIARNGFEVVVPAPETFGGPAF